MGRTNGLRNQPLVLDVGNNNQVLMNTRDFDMDVAPGVRLLTVRRSDVGPGGNLDTQASSMPSPTRVFRTASFPRRETWRSNWMVGRPPRTSGLPINHCVCSDLIAGFVWAGLYEQADSSTAAVVDPMPGSGPACRPAGSMMRRIPPTRMDTSALRRPDGASKESSRNELACGADRFSARTPPVMRLATNRTTTFPLAAGVAPVPTCRSSNDRPLAA